MSRQVSFVFCADEEVLLVVVSCEDSVETTQPVCPVTLGKGSRLSRGVSTRDSLGCGVLVGFTVSLQIRSVSSHPTMQQSLASCTVLFRNGFGSSTFLGDFFDKTLIVV